MNKIITEKDYPIRLRWLFLPPKFKKGSGGVLVYFLLLSWLMQWLTSLLPGYYVDPLLPRGIQILLVGSILIRLMFLTIKRSGFHFSVGDSFITLNQILVLRPFFSGSSGGFHLNEKRDIPYGRIQHLVIKQRFFERFFGLASLNIETASEDVFIVPGLLKNDAAALKNIILKKIDENPIKDSASGV